MQPTVENTENTSDNSVIYNTKTAGIYIFEKHALKNPHNHGTKTQQKHSELKFRSRQQNKCVFCLWKCLLHLQWLALWCCDPLRMFSHSEHAWPQSPAHLISVNTTTRPWTSASAPCSGLLGKLASGMVPACLGSICSRCGPCHECVDVQVGNQWDGGCCRLQTLENVRERVPVQRHGGLQRTNKWSLPDGMTGFFFFVCVLAVC